MFSNHNWTSAVSGCWEPTCVLRESVCVDVGDPVLELGVVLDVFVSSVVQLDPAEDKPAGHTDLSRPAGARRRATGLGCARLPVQHVPDPPGVLSVEAARQFVHAAVQQVVGNAHGPIVDGGRRSAEDVWNGLQTRTHSLQNQNQAIRALIILPQFLRFVSN